MAEGDDDGDDGDDGGDELPCVDHDPLNEGAVIKIRKICDKIRAFLGRNVAK